MVITCVFWLSSGDVIPADSTLVFEVSLVAIEDAPKPNNIFKDIDTDGDNLLSQDEVGNWATLCLCYLM